MTDYTELIKALRHCVNDDDYCAQCERYEEGLWCGDKLINEAADAIEELAKDLERSKEWESFWEKEANEALKKFQLAESHLKECGYD